MRTRFHDDMTMDAIMREWPETIRVILDHGLLCVGCPIAPFHTVADAAREHGVDEAAVIRDLKAAILSAAKDSARSMERPSASRPERPA